MTTIQDLHIGDEVRFLDSVGGGRITRIDAIRKLVYVEDADGFEIPTPISQVVINISTHTRQKSSKEVSIIENSSKDIMPKESAYLFREERRAKGKKESKKEEILEVDLHISVLSDHWMQMEKHEIRNYQLQVFRRTMHENLRNRGKKIVFIHGRGEGILKAAITAELTKSFPQCEFYDASFAQYGFGATMVVIK